MSPESDSQNNKKPQSNYIGIGIALGAGIGTALGAGLGVAFDFFPMSIGVGTGIGAGMGIVIGAVLQQASQNEK